MNSFDIFTKTLRSIADVPDRAIEEILEISNTVQLVKGENFIRAGDVPAKFAFVVKGLFRYYYLNASGQEFTKGFFPEHSFLSSYSAMIQKRESYFTIEALEPSSIIVIPYAEWHELTSNDLFWNKFLVALLEKGYGNKEAREREFLLFDAEQRYRSFLDSFPGLEKRIKQHHIASYLGINPVSLSRIRKKYHSLT